MDQSNVDVIAWTKLGLLLLEVKANDKWRSEAGSFSAWVQAEATKRGLQASVLWRDLSAVRFYLSAIQEYQELKLPPLEQPQASLSAEQLELIQKISRTAPRELTTDLLKGAVDGTLTREHLRNVWRLYQPLTAPASRHGRAPAAAKDQSARYEANALSRLQRACSAWIGGGGAPKMYRLFTRPISPAHLPRSLTERIGRLPDMIAIVQQTAQDDVVLHGIEFVMAARPSEPRLRLLVRMAESFEFFWAGIPFEAGGKLVQPRLFLRGLPPYVGLLQLDQDRIDLIRPPSRRKDSRANQADIAMLLLAHAGP